MKEGHKEGHWCTSKGEGKRVDALYLFVNVVT